MVALLEIGVMHRRGSTSFDRLKQKASFVSKMTSCENMAASLRSCPAVLRQCSRPDGDCDAATVCTQCFYFSKPFCASPAVVSDTWGDYNVSPKAHHQMKRMSVHALPKAAGHKAKGKTGTRMAGRGMPADWSKDRVFQAVDVPEVLPDQSQQPADA